MHLMASNANSEPHLLKVLPHAEVALMLQVFITLVLWLICLFQKQLKPEVLFNICQIGLIDQVLLWLYAAFCMYRILEVISAGGKPNRKTSILLALGSLILSSGLSGAFLLVTTAWSVQILLDMTGLPNNYSTSGNFAIVFMIGAGIILVTCTLGICTACTWLHLKQTKLVANFINAKSSPESRVNGKFYGILLGASLSALTLYFFQFNPTQVPLAQAFIASSMSIQFLYFAFVCRRLRKIEGTFYQL